MTAAANLGEFQYMVDCGVPKIEVLWLARMQGSPKLEHPVAARRAQTIRTQALKGLMNKWLAQPSTRR